jgi:hypothetical protein
MFLIHITQIIGMLSITTMSLLKSLNLNLKNYVLLLAKEKKLQHGIQINHPLAMVDNLYLIIMDQKIE